MLDACLGNMCIVSHLDENNYDLRAVVVLEIEMWGNADVVNADVLAADDADFLAADNEDVLAADTTDVLAVDKYVAFEEDGLRRLFSAKTEIL